MVSIAVPPFSEIEVGVIATVAVWEKTLIEILKNNGLQVFDIILNTF